MHKRINIPKELLWDYKICATPLVLRSPYFLHLPRYREHHALADISGPVSSTLEVVGNPYEAGGTVGCLGVNHHEGEELPKNLVIKTVNDTI